MQRSQCAYFCTCHSSKYKNNCDLSEMWTCVTSLLRICQVAYSSEINEADLTTLEKDIRVHLESIQKTFKIKLTPKHHLLIHYCRVIRTMGPLIYMSMMRFENKHKNFKNHVKRSNNFMNINKSLALQHQQFICKQENSYKNEITTGAKTPITDDFINNHDMFESQITNGKPIFILKWLRCNGTFKKGLLIINQSVVFEIDKILWVNNNYKFLCNKIDNLGLDIYSNSLEIQQSSPVKNDLIILHKLVHKQSYEYKQCYEKLYLIADTLDLKNINKNW